MKDNFTLIFMAKPNFSLLLDFFSITCSSNKEADGFQAMSIPHVVPPVSL
jgi:hypothetical protein